MNERIRELANSVMVSQPYSYRNNFIIFTQDEFDKFAELIVRECAEIADEAFVKQMGHMKPGRFVKEHFGVKE
jgi:hypothetical protein